jgi:SAM-dependent methyltransferase
MGLASPHERGRREPRRQADGEDEAVWHDLECGRYRADLALWLDLAARAAQTPAADRDDAPGAPATAHADARVRAPGALVLDVGAGTGRVALHLAGAGHRVTALELDPVLVRALERRAAGTSVRVLAGDARTLQLRRRDFQLCVVAMQTVQLLGGPAARGEFLRRARAHLRPGGLLACAIVTDVEPFDCAAGDTAPSTEMTRVRGTLYTSSPTRVQVRRRAIRIERERVALPAGRAVESAHALRHTNVVELDRVTPGQLAREGLEAGLSADDIVEVAPTEDHVGSTVVVWRG